MLYDGVQEEVKTHLLAVAQIVATNPDETLLQSLGQKWRLHKVTMVMIRDILMYMVRARCTGGGGTRWAGRLPPRSW